MSLYKMIVNHDLDKPGLGGNKSFLKLWNFWKIHYTLYVYLDLIINNKNI